MGRKQTGFTMVELLVVIALIGVIATVVIVILNPVAQLSKAHDAERKSDLRTIRLALDQYYSDNQKYPQAGSCAYGSNCYVYSTDGTSWIPALVPKYAAILPIDPINNGIQAWYITANYSYSYGNVASDGQSYDLTAKLEDPNDPDRCGIKNYTYGEGLPGGSQPWCVSFGGNYSDQIYEYSPPF